MTGQLSHPALERTVVGSIAVFGAAALDRLAGLRAEDLTLRGFPELLEAAREVVAAGAELDTVSLHDAVEARHPRLLSLIDLNRYADEAARPAMLPRHVAELRRLSELRRLRAQALDLAQSVSPDATPAELRQRAARIAEDRAEDKGPRPAREGLAELMRSWREGPPPRLPWGLDDLERTIGGMRPGNVYLVGGRPGHGKTSLVLGVAADLAVPRSLQRALGTGDAVRPVLVFSLEMPEAEVLEAVLARESRVDARRIAARELSEEELEAIGEAAQRIAAGRLMIDDESFALPQIEERAHAWRRANGDGLGLVVIDYAQLVVPAGKNHKSREQEVAEVSRGLKRLAKRLRCPILAVVALNRASEARQNHRPGLADMRESGALEYDASAIALLYREELYLVDGSQESRQRLAEVEGVGEVIVCKNRHGATGPERLAFLKKQRRWAPLARGPRGGLT